MQPPHTVAGPPGRISRSIPGTEGLTPAPPRHAAATPSLLSFPTASMLSRTGLTDGGSAAGASRRFATVGKVRDAVAGLVEKCDRSRDRLARLDKIVDSLSRCAPQHCTPCARLHTHLQHV